MTDKRERILAEIDACTPDDLIAGLRVAIIAYGIKVSRTRQLSAKEVQHMRTRAVLMARTLLEISTGNVPL